MSQISTGQEVDLQVGDLVALTTVPRGRERRLHAGQRGRVLVAPDGQELHLASVLFMGERYPHQVNPRHLRRIEED